MTALAKAQGAIQDIERDRTVIVQPRTGNSYQFKYATLAAIIKGIKKALSDNGIAYTQVLTFETNDRLYYLTTSLHYKNQFVSSVTPLIIGEAGGNQQFGSALTYMKRYALAALVGVAADEDDDGNIADGNEVKAMQEAVNRSKPAKPAVNPISTGTGIYPDPEPPASLRIDVPMLADESGPDWMTWGQSFMKLARTSMSLEGLEALQEANKEPFKTMEQVAPKMFASLSVALINTRKKLERVNA